VKRRIPQNRKTWCQDGDEFTRRRGESQRDSVTQPRVASPRATLGKPHQKFTTLKGLRPSLAEPLQIPVTANRRKWSVDNPTRLVVIRSENETKQAGSTKARLGGITR